MQKDFCPCFEQYIYRISVYYDLSHAGQNYWMLIAWDRGHFFLNQEGTFGNQEGMITWCWLAEHACIKLVFRCFPLQTDFEKKFQKCVACEFDLTRSFHLKVNENQHTTKHSLLVEKHKDFSDQKRIDSQPENSLSGDGWCWTKH